MSVLELLLLHPKGFGSSCFCRHLFLGMFSNSFFISSVSCLLFRNVLFNLHVTVFKSFFFFSCNWYLVSASWSEKMLDTISIFLNLLRLNLWPQMWSVLENVLCTLVKNHIHLHLDGMSWRYQLDPSALMCHLRLMLPY